MATKNKKSETKKTQATSPLLVGIGIAIIIWLLIAILGTDEWASGVVRNTIFGFIISIAMICEGATSVKGRFWIWIGVLLIALISVTGFMDALYCFDAQPWWYQIDPLWGKTYTCL